MIDDKTILITGGTGSFGRKFVEIALTRYQPKRLIVFSRDELKQHDMGLQFNDPRLDFFLGDVREVGRLSRAFRAEVDVVIHAAALKQVPACEYNPFEAVKTNVLGAKNVVDAAIDCSVPKVIALSTDKAVNPINLYGATKLCAEKLLVQGNSYAGGEGSRFSCVRYGNVLGSRGSVLPIFLAQRGRGTITLTDPRMTRFWITLEEAVEFVIRCTEVMEGGEVFVPRIPSMTVSDMARALAPNCLIKVTGIRPGEKLNETLVSCDEARRTLALPEMFVIKPEHHPWGPLDWEGDSMPEGSDFASDSNDRWLKPEDLLRLVGEDEEELKLGSARG